MPAPNLHVSQHPAVLHKLAILRDEKTEPKKFREVVRELSWLLGYEALADVGVKPLEIRTPLEPMTAARARRADRVRADPAGGARDGRRDARADADRARSGTSGLFRDERTLRPVEYYNKLPDSATVDLCLILDPMLATGGSATAAIEVLKKWGAVQPVRIKLVNLIAAPEGVAAVTAAHPDVDIYCAALDRSLNEKGYIQPGPGRRRRPPVRDRPLGLGLPSSGWSIRRIIGHRPEWPHPRTDTAERPGWSRLEGEPHGRANSAACRADERTTRRDARSHQGRRQRRAEAHGAGNRPALGDRGAQDRSTG